jgi:Fic family protein
MFIEASERSFGEQLESFLIGNNAVEHIYDGDSLDQAGYAWCYLISHQIISESAIQGTHRLITKNQCLPQDRKGVWRREDVWVGKQKAPSWETVPELMNEWIRKANRYQSADITKEEKDGLLLELHLEFEKIHPFVDGNGRTGRMLWNFQRLKCGLPLAIINEKNKEAYMQLFQN